MKNVEVNASADTTVTDLRAALDTYGVEITLPDELQPEGKPVLMTVPLFYIDRWAQLFGDNPVEALEGVPGRPTAPDLYEHLTLTLVDTPTVIPVNLVGTADFRRWPFFVEHDMTITIQLDAHRWTATFKPRHTLKLFGRVYQTPFRKYYSELECTKSE